MVFRTVYERTRVYSNPGCREVDEFSFVKNENGEEELKKTGTFSIYDQIQSYKESTSLDRIIEKFMITGDPAVLQQRQGFYADVSDYPQTYAEMLEITRKAKEFFDTLPADDRAKFNNDPDQFIASIGTEKWDSLFGVSDNSVQSDNVAESEVVENE